MRVVILQSNYIPWKGYFELILEADVFCFYDEVKYTKNDWRNRNKLLDKNGEFWLSIPISKKSVNEKISEVLLPGPEWQQKHFDTIIATYYNAPQKELLTPLLEDIYLNTNWQFLSELNQYIIRKVAEYIGINTTFKNSAAYNLEGDRINRLISLIKQIGGDEYISGPTAIDYLKGSEDFFFNENIKLTFKNYGPYRTYPQNTKSFSNYVSIIDLLMFVPKDEAVNYIISINDPI